MKAQEPLADSEGHAGEKRPKMIYVGSLSREPDRDWLWIEALDRLGWDVQPFSSLINFPARSLLQRVKLRFAIGPENREMQARLVELVRARQPVWVHFRLPIAFNRRTIEAIRALGAIVTCYFNDDPFSPEAPFGLNWKFQLAVPAFDGHFVYRRRNVQEFLDAGAREVRHCPPTYDPARRPCSVNADGSLLANAAFIGHWESDWRADCLEALERAGFSVIVHGSGWNERLAKGPLNKLVPVAPVFGEGYNRTYANVGAGLCFFSKINRDLWTERPLEIVAVGGVLVCERTPEAEGYFRDGEEAFFFSTIEELIGVCANLCARPEIREQVRAAGRARLAASHHTITDRAQEIISFVQQTRRTNKRDILISKHQNRS